MARIRKPSYKKAIKGWVRFKLTGRGVALKHPVRATFKARRYIRQRELGISQYKEIRKYLK